MYQKDILIHMKTTLNISDEILGRAKELTGVMEKTLLVHMGLEALIERAASRRLAKLGGTQRGLRDIPRCRGAHGPR